MTARLILAPLLLRLNEPNMAYTERLSDDRACHLQHYGYVHEHDSFPFLATERARTLINCSYNCFMYN